MNAKKVQVFRTYDDGKQCLGIMSVTDTSGVCFTARTLELPWKMNANNISCFTPGKYICRHTQSASLRDSEGKPLKTYEIMNIPGRAGVRVHSANFVSQLRGCIALGDSHKDLNADGLSDVPHSGDTVKAFEKLMNFEDFELEILDVRS